MTVMQTLRLIREELSGVAAECALPEAERILAFLLNCSRSGLYLSGNRELPPETSEKTRKIIKRRHKDEPLAYILGSAYFYNREFIVTPDVLIPRPDTEMLVEEILNNEPRGARRFLDMGTGSGCIAAILMKQHPSWNASASDISFSAMKTAKKNCPNNVMLLCCDRLSAIKSKAHFDFMVCNPPYIRSSVLPTLEKSVRGFEPLRALDGGPDGLDFYRYLAKAAPPLLKKGGRIYCEIGYDQGDEVPAILKQSGWHSVRVVHDNAGRTRVVRAEKGEH